MWLALTSCLVALPAWADVQTQRLAVRLSEQAAAFAALAPEVIGTETLHQRAQKPPRRFRFRIRIGTNNVPEWQERDLVSEYAYTTFASDGGLHELREVTSVDGKPVKDAMSPEELAQLVIATDDERKRELLERFEEHGLVGAANDFGQLLLLFAPGNIEKYEFALLRRADFEGNPALVFSYEQIDGPDGLTVIDGRERKTQEFELEGEIWVSEDDYALLKMTVDVRQNSFDELEPADRIRQRATVTYQPSPWGPLLPAQTDHFDYRGNTLVAENHFTYSDFRRFSSTSEINFEVVEQEPVIEELPPPPGLPPRLQVPPPETPASEPASEPEGTSNE